MFVLEYRKKTMNKQIQEQIKLNVELIEECQDYLDQTTMLEILQDMQFDLEQVIQMNSHELAQ